MCMSLKDATLLHGPDYNYTSQFAGDGYGISYNNWDGNAVLVCQCDVNYMGPDCSQSIFFSSISF